MAIIIDGKKIANSLHEKLSKKINVLKREHNIFPCLKVILVGNNPASQVYVRNKQKKAESIGISSETIVLPDNISENKLITKINELNIDPSVHGILVQLPLPKHINASRVINIVSVKKDVDGFHDENVGRLVKGEKNCLIPCTPKASLYLIKSIEKNLSSKNAVVIGRSNIVGKPMFHLLLQENCTVTILHSQSRNLAECCSKADIVVAAVGKPRFIQEDWVKKSAIVIDVGINNVNVGGQARFIGDVDFDGIKEKAKAITPVPGGVGPMTIAFLMVNTVIATCLQKGVDTSDL
ncbi:bifunctional methylenetetrahydrofolate dehydrogenase/methenyltetrahydrofolate cyclohydrolase FolD [Wolbachia endosymbiont of Dirofilaria (Dirofilaria) immitis]|uniref:bifunctional methylenetetrahydrofolate dehydrogenase/methenyltetrahydrofolate cyclohydrolase FolD n=1 Tax=Wolbachia endosymbiont of Dirofilaria (Dirofilaria) immitis TaxID=1812115 RepID=UPI00158C04A0|nr:bifunctional methylenetetrahydrofolate dehydrogenase/methenyltetrahydrofolate cyclohydrolase FolD [Wolbachia endosymbiont of Dirofilaria (Dirofilaria) immitis]QKX02536.1 bifunctional methylenetetrahydrofolate dehydrogenase/methenyltetrahydrofolate cyclohydrolase FolD [Wolbachia endosymbiont of Dirofilaria (Dirofilaria) immitis]